ncbi:hypothetical protein [Rhodanobacter sp. MP1X3]|uniref:hypothetical protein n=1 Tax=Rhodanobacter sp. MP1X3 TaxID=2723086 RepID=UPI00160800E6|nr:hypothetical protein [Rhodanobacter sp. MP1X3]MBB6243735.1 hypothetical protein [Rhodanobacter sp. MP1X3]
MNDPSVVPDPVQKIELPSMLEGIEYFKGSAGLVIAWKLEKEKSRPPTLVCKLYTRRPHDAPSYVPPSGTLTIQLSPKSAPQPFWLERQPLLGEIVPESDGVNPFQTHGLIYLGGLLASPDSAIPVVFPHHAHLYLHVHCQLGASNGCRAKIAQGTYGLFMERPNAPEKAETPPSEKSAKPLTAASTGKRPADKSKAGTGKKRSH